MQSCGIALLVALSGGDGASATRIDAHRGGARFRAATPFLQPTAPSDISPFREAIIKSALLLRESAPKEGGGSVASQPIGMQLSDEDVKEFQGRLSKACGAQFTAMLHGNGTGSALHTFQDSDSKEAAAVQCRELNGSLCVTQAHLEENIQHQGRDVVSAVDVEGNGCVPNQCHDKSDLQAWANFMHTTVMAQFRGRPLTVALDVDCTASGGATVFVGHGSQKKVEAESGAEKKSSASEAVAKSSSAAESARAAAKEASQASHQSSAAAAKGEKQSAEAYGKIAEAAKSTAEANATAADANRLITEAKLR